MILLYIYRIIEYFCRIYLIIFEVWVAEWSRSVTSDDHNFCATDHLLRLSGISKFGDFFFWKLKFPGVLSTNQEKHGCIVNLFSVWIYCSSNIYITQRSTNQNGFQIVMFPLQKGALLLLCCDYLYLTALFLVRNKLDVSGFISKTREYRCCHSLSV